MKFYVLFKLSLNSLPFPSLLYPPLHFPLLQPEFRSSSGISPMNYVFSFNIFKFCLVFGLLVYLFVLPIAKRVSHTKINMLCLILRLFFILYIKFMCCHPCLLKYNQITPVLTAAVIFFIPEVWLKILIALHQSTQSYQESILYNIFKNDKWCLTLMLNASITSSSPLNGIHISYHSLHGPKLSTHCLTHQPCFFPSRLTAYSTWSLFRG